MGGRPLRNPTYTIPTLYYGIQSFNSHLYIHRYVELIIMIDEKPYRIVCTYILVV